MAPGNKDSKRSKVDKDKTVIFVVVAVAAVISVGALMASKGFLSQVSYMNKVADKKGAAVEQLKENKLAVDTLKESYDTFRDQSPNLIGGSSEGTGDRDGDNAKLVLDSLPSNYDFPALTSSLEQLLFGFKINAISGIDDSIAQLGSAQAGLVEIPVSIDVMTRYEGTKRLFDVLDKSIRPFHITAVEMRGSDSDLQTAIQMKTFYQPEKGVEIKKEEVQ